MAEPEPPSLKRSLGLVDAVGIGLGAIIGAGIFVVIGVAAGVAGRGLLLSLVIGALVATANALSSAQLAAAYPQTGGTYEYGYRVLTPTVGFTAGWLFIVSKISAAGAVALGLAGYIETLLPGMRPRLAAVVVVLLFTALNYFGIRRSSAANLLIVAISLAALLTFTVWGYSALRARAIFEVGTPGAGSILQGAAIIFFAYTGYARVATLAGEVREPQRTIPRAIILTIAGAVLLYLAVAWVALRAVGSGALASSPAPLHLAAGSIGGEALQVIISVGALTAMLGVILSQLLGLSRMVYAMAGRRDLPSYLDHVHPVHGAPDRAVLVIGAIVAMVTLTIDLGPVAAAASFSILVYYGIANVASLRMPRAAKRFHDGIAWFGLAACVILALSLPRGTIAAGVAVLAIGLAGRALLRRGRKD